MPLWIAKYVSGPRQRVVPESDQRNAIIREGGIGVVASGGLNLLKAFSAELRRIVPFN